MASKVRVPKIKYTVEFLKITCALKNIYGCNPYPKKYRYHAQLEEAIVAINKAMKFDLCIIDGNVVSGINPCRLGLVMSSQDPVAIDVAAGEIAGVRSQSIRYLKIAANERLGNAAFYARGLPLNYFRSRYPKKNARTILTGKALALLTRSGLRKRLGF